jgi:RNA polymerase sigma-70 factor (ECF subfamily)
MQGHNAKPPQNLDALDDTGRLGLLRLARRKVKIAFCSILHHNHRRLDRIARSVVPDDSKAEDVLQEADLRSFGSLGQFRGDSSLATWLTPLTLNEALARLRRQRPMVDLAVPDAQSSSKAQVIPFPVTPDFDRGRVAAHRQMHHRIEQAIGSAPQIFGVAAITSNGVYRRAKP